MAKARRRRAVQADSIDNVATRVRIEYRDLNELEPYEDNPRQNEEAVQSVANSIRNFGFLVPIVIDEDGIIVAGHTRFEAAKTIGMTEAPTIRADHLTPDQARQFRLIDNKVSELARWDMDLLSGEITALSESGIDFTEFGWTREEVDCLTDVVSDDCLSASTVVDEEEESSHRRADPRAPSQARVVISEFVFFLPMQVYRRWANQLRVECNYDEEAIKTELQERLGMTPYIEAEDS